MTEHRIIEKKDIEKVEHFIESASKLLREGDDDDFIEFYGKTLETSKTAQKAAADNNEKWTYLFSAVTQWANKLMFRLFEYNLTTPELIEEYYALERQGDVAKLVQAYADERKMAEDELVAQMKPHHEARQGIGVFIGILEGRTPEEAKQAQAEYQERVAQATKGA